MADVPTNSGFCPRSTDPTKLRAEPRPTVAFGFVLDYQCRLRWARRCIAEHQKEKPGAYTPEQFEDMLDCIVLTMNRAIPEDVYAASPTFPASAGASCLSGTASLSPITCGCLCCVTTARRGESAPR